MDHHNQMDHHRNDLVPEHAGFPFAKNPAHQAFPFTKNPAHQLTPGAPHETLLLTEQAHRLLKKEDQAQQLRPHKTSFPAFYMSGFNALSLVCESCFCSTNNQTLLLQMLGIPAVFIIMILRISDNPFDSLVAESASWKVHGIVAAFSCSDVYSNALLYATPAHKSVNHPHNQFLEGTGACNSSHHHL